MKTKNKVIIFALINLTIMKVAYAQEIEQPGKYYSFDLSYNHDDNIYRVIDELANEDSYFNLKPKINLVGAFGKHRLDFDYKGDYSKYLDYNDASYDDHSLKTSLSLNHSVKFQTKIIASYQRDHEEPGTINRVQLDITEYNLYEMSFIDVSGVYGRPQASGRIEFGYRKVDKENLNNGLDYLSYISDQYDGKFIYKIAPKTNTYIQLSSSELDYENNGNFELDNEYRRYRLGLTWEFTNTMTGDVNVGYQDRDYKQENITDISGLAYYISLDWSATERTNINFNASREAIDSSLEEASGFLRTTYSSDMTHELTELLEVGIELGYSQDDLVNTSDRKDKRYFLGLKLNYKLLDYIDLDGGYYFDQRKSTTELANFESNMFKINVSVELEN